MSEAPDGLKDALEGRYTIERELGEGGMATVYLANDLKHNRPVALKVLKPELAAVVGAERFLAEIETTAALRHPHILPLFDSGEADSFLYYVMPYVEGETLRQRIDRDRQLPVEEAVRVATAVAQALQHAHDKGVIHRDIKPGNILIQEGQPVVADFGIALAVGSAGAARLTETGLSVGTPYYMSPEQATGDRVVGSATDTYALACVLYEMLTGDPPYIGSTAQAVLGKIIQGEPVPATQIRSSVPVNVDAAVRRALEKLPADRFMSAQDFARALADPGFRHGEVAESALRVGYSTRTVAALAATAAVIAVLALWGWLGDAPALEPHVTRLTATLPTDHRLRLAHSNTFPIALSPDGGTLAHVGESDEGNRLYVRPLDDYDADALSGTEDASHPFFSADGQEIAYFADGWLNRVRVSGGAPNRIAELTGTPRGGAWAPDDVIVFAAGSALWHVDPGGTQLERVQVDVDGRVSWPSFLREESGEAITRLVLTRIGAELHVVSLDDGVARPLGITTNGHGLHVPGYIVYTEMTGIVRAAPFDLESLQVTGAETSVLDNVLRPNQTQAALLAISATGTMVYVPGASERRLVLVDRSGNETDLAFPASDYRFPTLSWDGEQVAVHSVVDGLVIFNLRRRAREREMPGLTAAWSPAGNELAISAGGLARLALAPGSEPELISDEPPGYPFQCGTDDLVILTSSNPDADNQAGIFIADLGGGDSIWTFLDTPADEAGAARSRDGRWIAYHSDESGRHQIYVQAFPEGVPRQVSLDGGRYPRWSPDGSELFYLRGENAYVVDTEPVERGGSFEPRLLFRRNSVTIGPPWDVRPDGRFVMIFAGPNWLREIRVVQNWTTELAGMLEGGSG